MKVAPAVQLALALFSLSLSLSLFVYLPLPLYHVAGTSEVFPLTATVVIVCFSLSFSYPPARLRVSGGQANKIEFLHKR